MKAKANAVGRVAILVVDDIVDTATLIVILLLLAFAAYALWDADQIYGDADKSLYTMYKPTSEAGKLSFLELQAINSEVFAWLHVYGTNIDYPVAQTTDNSKYVHTNIEGEYSMTGAIFLDYNNSMDFSDFNSILYGHNMEKRVMFGDINAFTDQDFFDSHRYGDLYFGGANHGIDFFAFVHTDAYDGSIFYITRRPDERQPYLDNILAKAMYTRDVPVTLDDNIVLLSTCSSSTTNGRDILFGLITSETYEFAE